MAGESWNPVEIDEFVGDAETTDKLLQTPRVASRASAADREAEESKSLVPPTDGRPTDGRKRKKRGPTAQLNVAILVSIKEQVDRIARAYGLSYVEIVERAVPLLAKELEKGLDGGTVK